MEVGPLKVSAILDLASNWNMNISKLKSDFTNVQVRSKELNRVWDAMGGILEGTAKAASLMGLSVMGFITGAVAMSPQLKEMWMKLKPVMFDLGNYIGTTLNPLFDTIVVTAQKWVDSFKQLDIKYGILEKISGVASEILKTFQQLPAEIQVGLVLAPALLGITKFIAWITGALGISGIATSAAGVLFSVPALVAFSAVWAGFSISELVTKEIPAIVEAWRSFKMAWEGMSAGEKAGLTPFQRGLGEAAYGIGRGIETLTPQTPLEATAGMLGGPIAPVLVRVVVQDSEGRRMHSSVTSRDRGG